MALLCKAPYGSPYLPSDDMSHPESDDTAADSKVDRGDGGGKLAKFG
jgi:hypothetical protein